VLVLLIIIYRSPIFWIFPLFAVIVAEIMSRAFGYGLTEVGVTVNGQSSAIGSIIVLGAGTDYALLLVSRYREELRRNATSTTRCASRCAPRRPRSSRRADRGGHAALADAGEGQLDGGPRPTGASAS
jgi:uncharacterized membrane protein YdfJ with MMPL/SSD domain